MPPPVTEVEAVSVTAFSAANSSSSALPPVAGECYVIISAVAWVPITGWQGIGASIHCVRRYAPPETYGAALDLNIRPSCRRGLLFLYVVLGLPAGRVPTVLNSFQVGHGAQGSCTPHRQRVVSTPTLIDRACCDANAMLYRVPVAVYVY